MIDLKNIVRSVDPKQKSKVGHLVGMTAVDSVDNIIANCLHSTKSQPASPRANNVPRAPVAPAAAPVHLQLPTHHAPLNDELPDLSLSLPTLNPQAHPLSIQQSRAAKPVIKMPGPASQKAPGQRPSQYRRGPPAPTSSDQGAITTSRSSSASGTGTGASSDEKAMAASQRPQSGGARQSDRAPSPIVIV